MAKKSKPALYELIDKSTLNPPDWAYKQKAPAPSTDTGSEAARQQPSQSGRRPFIPPHVATPGTAKKEKPPFKLDLGPLTDRIKALGGRMKSPAFIIIVGGILISIVIVYLFDRNDVPNPASQSPGMAVSAPDSSAGGPTGQQAAVNPGASDNLIAGSPSTDTPPLPEELAAARAQPPRETIWPDARFSMDLDTEPADAGTDSASGTTAQPTGQCWILCGNSQREPLLYVQKYFSDNGLETVIAKFDGRFVLVTKETFASSKSPEAKNLKNLLEKIGKYYNNNRPKEAPRYSLATFQTAYPVNVSRITLNP